MSRFVKVTGYLEIEDSEYDSGPAGPLTEEAYIQHATIDSDMPTKLHELEDIEFEEDDR